jgi:hypothetical protein
MPIRFLGTDFEINRLCDFGSDATLSHQQLRQITTLADGRFAITCEAAFVGGYHSDTALLAPISAGTPIAPDAGWSVQARPNARPTDFA